MPIEQSKPGELAVIDEQLSADGSVGGRECGTCTVCCTVLAIAEMNKPMRWACDHVTCTGCGIYEKRPQACRDFDCAWLRGLLPSQGELQDDDSLRPDKLGVLFDFFYSTANSKSRFVAFELWRGAFDEASAAAILNKIAASREVELSYRDGTWRTIGTTCQVDA